MIEIIGAVLTCALFVLGVSMGFYLTKKFVGERMWREGYLYGFNLAWDEKKKADEAARAKFLKDIRKKRPRFTIVKGDKR